VLLIDCDNGIGAVRAGRRIAPRLWLSTCTVLMRTEPVWMACNFMARLLSTAKVMWALAREVGGCDMLSEEEPTKVATYRGS
jgi:hypothetical protein